MTFQQLHELLRIELLRRIEEGALTGTRLAELSSFRQAHVSNFLNKKRSLSLEGLDRMLAAQDLTIEQLLPVDLAASAPANEREAVRPGVIKHSPLNSDWAEAVPVVAASTAAEEHTIPPALVLETIYISATRLSEIRARASQINRQWQRFVGIRATGQQAAAMQAVLTGATVAIIDRHYNTLVPYRTDQPTIYAVRYGSSLLLRFVEFDDGCLILRPSAIDHPVHLLTVGPDETPSDYIVGRVCLLVHEL
jgi:hypothetical protein